MSGPNRVELSVRPNGTGVLRINGTDYSDLIVGFGLTVRAGAGATLVLELAVFEATVEADDVKITARGPVDLE